MKASAKKEKDEDEWKQEDEQIKAEPDEECDKEGEEEEAEDEPILKHEPESKSGVAEEKLILKTRPGHEMAMTVPIPWVVYIYFAFSI